jgi:hypothetical protein
VWIKLAPAALPELRASILDAYARRYCHANPGFAAVDVYATVQRLTTDNLDLHRGTRTHLLSFRNVNGEAHVTQMCLVPPAFS